jgi:hypothetical protein
MEAAELKLTLDLIKTDVSEIKEQTIKTNGRVTALEKRMLVATTAIIIVVVLKFPELIALLKFL